MEFKLLGSGDGGGGDSMGNVFSQGVPTLDSILGASRDFIKGGLDLAGTRMQVDATNNREFIDAQMEMNAKRRAESKDRLNLKLANEGTLAAMLGEYDSLLDAMSMADDEESKAMIPIIMMDRARLMNVMKSNMTQKALGSYLEREKSRGTAPVHSKDLPALLGRGQGESEQASPSPQTPSGEKTKSPPKEEGIQITEINI